MATPFVDGFRSSHAIQCEYGHTPVALIKDDVRSEMMLACDDSLGMLTISPFSLSVANILRWRGPVMVCDRDPVVTKAAERMREQLPRLNIQAPFNCLVEELVPLYVAKYGSKGLSLIDLDLTGSLPTILPVLEDVLMPLVKDNYKGKVYLTFNERGDGMHSTAARMTWLAKQLAQLSTRIKVGKERSYLSDRWDDRARLEPGSNMCIVPFTVKRA